MDDLNELFPPFKPDPSQTVVDPVALGLSDGQETSERSQEQEPEEGSVEWYQRMLTQKDQQIDQVRRESSHKIGEVTSQLSQMQQTFNEFLSRQQATAGENAGSAYQSQDSSQDEPDWLAYFAGGTEQKVQQPNGQQQKPQQGQDVTVLARQIAQEEIGKTLQSINQQNEMGQALVQDFMTNQSDLMPQAKLVQTLLRQSNPNAPIQERYAQAVATVRAMKQSGQITDPAPAHGPHGAMPPPAGGGQMNPYGMMPQAGQGSGGERYDEKFQRDELARIQAQRKAFQSSRM